MSTSIKHHLARAVFSLFVALFFVTPVCTIFVPFCTLTWTLGVLGISTPVYLLTGKRREATKAIPSAADGDLAAS